MKAGVTAGEHRRLDLLDLPIVLGVEDVVDGGESDVLVAAAVAGDEVRVEQLVVVGRRVEVIAEQAFWTKVRVWRLAEFGALPPGPSASNIPGAA